MKMIVVKNQMNQKEFQETIFNKIEIQDQVTTLVLKELIIRKKLLKPKK